MKLLVNHGFPNEKIFINVSDIHIVEADENMPLHKLYFYTKEDNTYHLEICHNYYVVKYGKNIVFI